MLNERQLSQVRAFSRKLEYAGEQCHTVHRALAELMAEAASVDVLRQGPAEDSGAKLADADLLLADFRGKLRELLSGVASLLSAQKLRDEVSALWWNFGGWDPEAGWLAWRVWEVGGKREVLADRNPAALLHKLELRNAEEARHA